MKLIKYFESVNSSLEQECELVHMIFQHEIYLDVVKFIQILDKLSFDWMKFGVVYTLVAKSDYFKINRLDFLDLLESIENRIEGDLDPAYDRYVEAMQMSVRTTLFDYFEQPGDLTLNSEFIEFIKSLTPYGVEIVKNISIENEIYELIIFIDSVRNI